MTPRQRARWERRKQEKLKALQIWLEEIELRLKRREEKKMNFLSGYKTYIVAALYGVVCVLEALGMVDSTFADRARDFLFAGGLAALRAGIK